MDLGWMADLEQMDQRAMLRDLGAAIDRARATNRRSVIEECLNGWQALAVAMQAERRRRRRVIVVEDQASQREP